MGRAAGRGRAACGRRRAYERRDRRHLDAAERPDDAAYDRFVHLARVYRDGGYADHRRGEFLVGDPLFNAIWLCPHTRWWRSRSGSAPIPARTARRRDASVALGAGDDLFQIIKVKLVERPQHFAAAARGGEPERQTEDRLLTVLRTIHHMT
jgi:hypothetical protein